KTLLLGAGEGKCRIKLDRLEQAATLADRALEKSFRERRNRQRADRDRSRRLTEHCDARGITAEGRDIAMDPIESGDLIEQAIITGGLMSGLCRECWMREEAEHAKTVVERDDDDAARGQLVAPIKRRRRGAAFEPAAIDPNHHRQFRRGV